MTGDGMRRILEDEALDLFDLGEVSVRVHAQERARRTILFTTVSRPPSGWRIEAGVDAQVALDREQIIRGLFLSRPARHHRDRIVRALRRAVAATNAGPRINIH